MKRKKVNLSNVATEKSSKYNNLEKMSVAEITCNINQEDETVPKAIKKILPQINRLIKEVVKTFNAGGHLFYLGAGSSGRYGIVDASECPPTFGVDHDMVVGLIAGGDGAIRKAIEGAEDNLNLGVSDLKSHDVSSKDFVIGIAASGRTPYVLGALKWCQKNKIPTGCIVCSPDSPIGKASNFPIQVFVGPEFVSGSTRMKCGTAQKLILNMITTAAMILIGKVEGNKMTHMKLSNSKLTQRGIETIMEKTGLSRKATIALLEKTAYSLPQALSLFKKKK